MWDLIIRGGRILDPATGTDGLGDLAVHQGRIGSVFEDLTQQQATHEVDARGLLVTPGLVDIHTHLWPGGGFWGVDPNAIAWRTGVTSWVDAGSSGAYTLEALRRHADGLAVSANALINVSAIGVTGETGEHHDLANLDVEAALAVAASHGDFVRGVKARIDRKTVGAHGTEPLRRARNLADRLERPLMVHIGYGPPTLADIEPFVREGDIVTHCASGAPRDLLVDGGLSAPLRRIVDRGVHLDIGHGSGAFAFDVLEKERAAGLNPIISTDLHAMSAQGPAFDMPTVMEKMIAVGWSIEEVFWAATAYPASVLGLGAGTLKAGAWADIALFSVDEQPHPVVDVHGQSRTAPVRLSAQNTFVAGRALAPMAPQAPPPWVKLSPAQRRVLAAQHKELTDLSAPRLQDIADFQEHFPRDNAAGQ